MSEEEKIPQTGLAEKVTSAYNEIRKKEYGELRQAFYEQHPEYLESDTVFNNDILGYIKQLQAENERLREIFEEIRVICFRKHTKEEMACLIIGEIDRGILKAERTHNGLPAD